MNRIMGPRGRRSGVRGRPDHAVLGVRTVRSVGFDACHTIRSAAPRAAYRRWHRARRPKWDDLSRLRAASSAARAGAMGAGRAGCRYKGTMTGLSVDYAGVAGKLGRPLDPAEVGRVLLDAAADRYQRVCPDSSLVQFTQSGATYLFDLASAAGAEVQDRTVAA